MCIPQVEGAVCRSGTDVRATVVERIRGRRGHSVVVTIYLIHRVAVPRYANGGLGGQKSNNLGSEQGVPIQFVMQEISQRLLVCDGMAAGIAWAKSLQDPAAQKLGSRGLSDPARSSRNQWPQRPRSF